MKHREFEFHFDGPQAEADAEDLARFLANEFPDSASRTVQRHSRPHAAGTRDIPIVIPIIALLVALPASVKAALDVSDRLKLTEKCARLVAWAKQRRARRQPNPFVALPPQGVKTPLDQARPERLAAALSDLAGTEEPQQP